MAGANFVKLNGKCINSTKPDQLLFSIEITRTVNRLIFGHQSCLFYSMFMFSRVFNKVRSRLVSIHRNSIDTGKMRRSSLDPTFLLA